jgi:hypothetical protein
MSIFSLLLGCAAEPVSPEPDSSETPSPAAPCASPGGPSGSEPHFDAPASLEIRMGEDLARPTLEGAVLSGPPLSLYGPTQQVGQCRLLEPVATFCEPACEPGLEQCLEGVCEPYPQRLPAGRLLLEADTFVQRVQPDALHGYWARLESSFAEITVSAEAFAVSACAVSPLVPSEDWAGVLAAREPGQDAILRWEPEEGARVSLRMTTGAETHAGLAHAVVECEGPDTGELSLPGALLEVLFSEGWDCGNCGTHALMRYRQGEAPAGEAQVRLRVSTPSYFLFVP